MTKTIVVALDGSPIAERAVPVAAWLAHGLGAEAHLVTASVGAADDADRAYLERQADLFGMSNVVTAVIEHRHAGAGISEYLQTQPDPVLCMSTRGRSGWGEVLLGSVSDHVLSAAQVPAVLVGPQCVIGDPPSRNLLLSIDGSDPSFAVLPTVAVWAEALGLSTHVVTAVQCGSDGRPDPRRDAATELVNETGDRLHDMGVDAERHVLNSAYPSDVVVAFAKGLPAALVAIGTHGRGGLSAKALGHVATDIVRDSPCPVLVRRIPD